MSLEIGQRNVGLIGNGKEKSAVVSEISVSKFGDLGPLGAKQGKHIASGLPDLLSHGNHGVDTYLDT